MAQFGSAHGSGPWGRRFESCHSDQMAYIERIQPLGVPLNVLTTIAEYYIANKPYDRDWCFLPVTNIESYLGSSALNKQYMNKIPTEFMQKKETSYGISVCKVNI